MARIEFEVKYSDHIKRETRILGADDDLFSLSKNMEQYRGYRISEVDPIRNRHSPCTDKGNYPFTLRERERVIFSWNKDFIIVFH